MAEKKAALGICDLCGQQIADPWTSKGKPRLYCSRECRNTGNSRAGAEERGRKTKERVAAGTWQNPAKLNPPTPAEQSRRARLARKREVARGEWRNPALSDEAREKLSRPRTITDPVLHRAMERLRAGAGVADLTPAEREAHRAYRKRLRDANREEVNRKARERYRRTQDAMTEEEREEQRRKWREANRRKAEKKKK